MKIATVTVSCGSTVPHPKYQYSSIREDVGATAELAEGESPSKAIALLQKYLGGLLDARITQRIEESL